MNNEYEIDGFDFDKQPQQELPKEEPQVIPEEPPVVEEPAAPVVEEPAAPVFEGPKTPFADSPYVMAAQPRIEPSVPAMPKEKPQRKGGFIAAILALAVVATCLGAGMIFLNFQRKVEIDTMREDFQEKLEQLQQQVEDNSYTGNGNSVSGSDNAPSDGMSPGQVYAKTYKSVVAVSCTVTSGGGFGQSVQGTSSGSGFIFSEDGYVATNYHVVEGASKIVVVTYDEQEHVATLVGYDQANDVAVLKVEAEGLHKADLGSSDDLIVGDQVVAIGHPLGNETATLTVGYVSAKDQAVTTDGSIINMLQTDAAINSGNSGGPLFNMKGEVIGITTAKYSGTTNSGASIESIGFAIPIDDVAAKMRDLIDYGYVTGAYLGVSVMDMNPEVMDAFGFPSGAYVAEVVEGNCAKKAGVQPKDMIIAVGEYKVDSVNGLTRALQKFKGGDTTTITVWRAGAELVLDITLDEKPVPDAAG